MRSTLLLSLLLCADIGSGQPLSLDSCIALAIRNQQYEGSRASALAIGDIQQKEAGSKWYPQVTLNAQSTYQNEQFSFPINLPNVAVPTVPLDFHRVLVDFSQTVYDGAVTKVRKRMADLDAQQQDLGLAARELDLRGQITQRYMAVLLSETQLDLLELQRNTLQQQRDRIAVAVQAGAALDSDVNVLEAALIAGEQQQVQVRYTVRTLRNELVRLTGSQLPATADLVAPTDGPTDRNTVEDRPDVRAFDLRLNALDAQSEMARAVRMPKLNIFGNAGAGNPGYNSFDNSWRPMLLIGAGLQWSILDRGTRVRTDRILDLQRTLVKNDRERLVDQLTMLVAQQRSDRDQYQELIASDERLVMLRAQVTAARSDQLANGTITASEYISELNNEQAARLGQKVHQLRSVLAIRTTNELLAK